MKRLAAAALAAALAVAGQDTQRETPPPGGAPKPFIVPPRKTTVLPNGLQISIVPYGTIPKAVITAVVRTGNIHEAADQIWIADITAALMKEGAGSRTGPQLADEAARMGGQLNVTVGADETRVSISVLSEFAADAVNLVADVVQRPSFPDSEFTRLRSDYIRRLNVALSSPQTIATQLFRKAIYPDHPYGRSLPTEGMLNNYEVEHTRKFYKANFGARRTHLYVAGRFDPAITKTVVSAFAKWTAGPQQSYPPPKAVMRKQVVTHDRASAAQSTIRLGLPVPDPAHRDYLIAEVANFLLGGSFMSRITTNIREQKGYTYSPFSSLTTQFHDAVWVQNADVTTEKTGPALTEIYNEIRSLRHTPPSEQELKGIQAALSGRFLLRNSSPEGIVNQLAFVDLQGLGDEWLNQWVSRVNAVKPADIQRIAETYLSPDKMTLVIVGDLAAIKDQIAPFQSEPQP